MSQPFFATCIALFLSPAFAMIDIYQFDQPNQKQRFFSLTHELRCPKCKNQSIADSNSPIAKDLRREVHRMLLAGESDQTISHFMLARYGDFVLYRPPVNNKTALLWLGPPVLLILSLFTLFIVVRKHRHLSNSPPDAKKPSSSHSSKRASV